jgi:uncharacterized ferredoxin-like protein
MIIDEEKSREEAIKMAAYTLLISARTAPKARGEDSLEILFVNGEEKDAIADKMIELGQSGRHKDFVRDGESVKKAQGVILIGVFGEKSIGLSCGACGYQSCEEFKNAKREKGNDFIGPNCIFKILDLGIALGSVAKLAGILGIDNRIMYRIGTTAKMLGIAKSDVVMGIPLISAAKNPFFDRR